VTDLNLNRPSFDRTNPRFGGVQKFLLLKGFTMNTHSALLSRFADKGEPGYDPDRTVTITVKASEAYVLRYIAAILADERCTDDGRTSIIEGCNATPQDMMKIHHKVYSDIMGWGHADLDR